MYLSKISLNPSIARESQLGLILKDRSYSIHRLLWDLFKKDERFKFREESQKEQLGGPRNLPLYFVLSDSKPMQNSAIFTVESKPYKPKLSEGDQLAFRLRANPVVTKSVERDSPDQYLAERSKRDVKDKNKLTKKRIRHDVVMNAQSQWLKQGCKERGLSFEGKKGELKKRLLAHEDFIGEKGRHDLERNLKETMDIAARNWLCERGPKMGFDLTPSRLQATAYRWNALPEKGRNAGFSSMDYEGVLTVTDVEKFLKQLYAGFGPSSAFGCGLMLIRRV